jgi:menaquinone-9 beta-reductase
METCDVVVVGSRVAGASVAAELARAGRRVIAVDAATFPSDTVSTHIVWPETVVELRELGVLDELLAADSPRLYGIHVEQGGHVADGTFSPVDGIDYALCPRRTRLDDLLVRRARALGAEVREGTRVIGLMREGERVAGVQVRGRNGEPGEIRARLVIGADGRRSTTARLVGAFEPHRRWDNGRGLVFAYVEDPAGDNRRHTLSQWRVGDTLTNYFPTDDGSAIALFMGPKEKVARFEWDDMVARSPQLRERMGGGRMLTRLRKTADNVSYFRRSTGPGWALVGDAGHFKDPVIAQGMRDGIHFGRSLGRVVARNLDDPAALDRILRIWERVRDRECTPTYYWGARLTRTHETSPVEREAFRSLESSAALAGELADVFGRQRRPRELTSLPRLARWTAQAWRRPGADRAAILRELADELRLDALEGIDRVRLSGPAVR